MTEISPEAIRAQLERILASPEFRAGERFRQFLRYVVEKTLDGESDSIKQYTIAREALGYPSGFDPQTNPTIRVLAGRLRRALDRYYSSPGRDDTLRVHIPSGSYVPTFLECPPALEASDSVSRLATGKRSSPTIAVVAFQSLTDEEGKDFVATGLTQEIIVALGSFPDLEVLGPLFPAGDGTPETSRTGNDGSPSYLLQGCVRSHGPVVRITAALQDTATRENLWARTFSFDLDSVSLFELEDEVSGEIAGSIADGLGIIFERLRTESYHEHLRLSEVTHSVLKYNEAWLTQAPESWKQALTAVDDALRLRPEDSLLLALQANIHYAAVLYDLGLDAESAVKFQSSAHKAVSLDPDLQLARYNLVVLSAYRGEADRCLAEARAVVAMNPKHARVLAGCAVAAASVGAYAYGLELIEQAKRLNPHYPGWYHFVDYLVHFGNARYQEAWEMCQLIHVEGSLWHPLLRSAILGKLGRSIEARPYVDELLQIKPDFAERAREYSRPLLSIDKHVEMVLDGLSRAGMRGIGRP